MYAPSEEQRGVIRFLTAEGVNQHEIHRRMKAVYGEHCLSLTATKRWSKRFSEGRVSVKDDERPGQTHRVITPETIAKVDALLQDNRQVSIDELASAVHISHGSVHTILHDHLHYR
jgi:response regulator of citrate/malate metabolism